MGAPRRSDSLPTRRPLPVPSPGDSSSSSSSEEEEEAAEEDHPPEEENLFQDPTLNEMHREHLANQRRRSMLTTEEREREDARTEWEFMDIEERVAMAAANPHLAQLYEEFRREGEECPAIFPGFVRMTDDDVPIDQRINIVYGPAIWEEEDGIIERIVRGQDMRTEWTRRQELYSLVPDLRELRDAIRRERDEVATRRRQITRQLEELRLEEDLIR